MTADEPSGMRQSESLGQFLRARARGSSDGRLALDVVLGILLTTCALLLRPWFWRPLLSAAVVLAAFGAWGMLDRELAERDATMRPGRRLLLGARAVASTVGWLAFIVFVVSALALAIGEWKL